MLKKLFLLLCAICLAGCSNYQMKETMHVEVDDFTHVNQHEKKVTLTDLKGKPWLAMFIFTNCTTVCPPMTFNMAEIHNALEEENIEDYAIVAFSIDPATDSPAVLADYLSNYEIADASKWQLLTGYEQLYIEQFARKSFNSFVQSSPNSDQVTHMSQFYLVNADGVTVNAYNGASDIPVSTIVEDVKYLSKQAAK